MEVHGWARVENETLNEEGLKVRVHISPISADEYSGVHPYRSKGKMGENNPPLGMEL